MTPEPDLLQRLASWFHDTVMALEGDLGDAEVRAAVLQDLGVANPSLAAAFQSDPDAVRGLNEYAQAQNPDAVALASALHDAATVATSIGDWVRLSIAVSADVSADVGVDGVDVNADVSADVNADGGDLDADEIAWLLAQYVGTTYVRHRAEGAYALARLLMLVEDTGLDVSPERLRLDRAWKFVTDDAYREQAWATFSRLETEADADRLSQALMAPVGAVVSVLAAPAEAQAQSDPSLHFSGIHVLYGSESAPGSPVPNVDRLMGRALSLGPQWTTGGAGAGGPYATAQLVPRAHGGPGVLLSLEPVPDLVVPVGGGWEVALESDAAALVHTFLPFEDFRDKFDWDTTGGGGALKLALRRSAQDERYIVGSATGTRLELAEVEVELGMEREGITARAGARKARLVVDISEGDGFLANLLSGSGLVLDFSLVLGWDPDRQFYLDGGATLEVLRPLSLTLGPVQVTGVRLTLGPGKDGGAALGLGVVVDAKLGPLKVGVDGLGLQLGSQEPYIGFKPPKGVGLAVDASVVQGGGYLFFDHEREEYAGVLQLEIFDIAVKAIGLLTTRMPDGSDGFSLLLIITAERAPCPTPLGFTLNGLGGLVGINRTVVTDVLREGIRARTLDSVMFPEDPIRNAPQIVSDLRRVFPPVQDQYVIGLMAILGWGVPTIITAELGIVSEAPTLRKIFCPDRVFILGQLRAMLPSAEVEPRLAEINMDVLGAIDIGQKEASFDAALYDSRIGLYTLEGEMAMRAKWGENRNFALAVGGLHPAFQPPPGFPSLKRLSVSLGKGNNPRLRMETYLALTSNSVQVGAHLDLYTAAAGFSVEGHLGFDALFQFSPFQFQIAICAGVALKAGGKTLLKVDLRFNLSGPRPWHAFGEATATLLFIDVTVPFDVTIGPRDQPELPVGEVWPKLKEALENPRSWSAELPRRGHQLVTLREDGATGVVVHPLGTLAVRQQVVPLGLMIEKFGNVSSGSERFFEITEVTFGENGSAAGGSADAQKPKELKEHFAPAQFFEMTDDEKVAAPSFERMVAGMGGFGTDGLTQPTAGDDVTTKTYALYTEVIDVELPPPPRSRGKDKRTPDHEPSDQAMRLAAERGAVANASLHRSGRARFEGKDKGITLEDDTYVLATTDTLAKVTEAGLAAANIAPIPELVHPNAGTYAGARVALRAHLRRHPEDEGRLQIVGAHEGALQPT